MVFFSKIVVLFSSFPSNFSSPPTFAFPIPISPRKAG